MLEVQPLLVSASNQDTYNAAHAVDTQTDWSVGVGVLV